MNRETYEIGEEVKVYLTRGVYRAIVQNKQEVAMNGDDAHVATTTLYLVRLKDARRDMFTLGDFMGKVRTAKGENL